VKESRLPKLLLALLVSVTLLFSQLETVQADEVTVETGYPTEGLEDLIWAAEYLGYENPGELQKAGVEVLRFLLVAIAQATGNDCESNLGGDLDPTGPNRYTTVWNEEEIEALNWLTDYYCLSEPQAQMLGGSVLTFLAGLDASINEEKENEDGSKKSSENNNTETLENTTRDTGPIKLNVTTGIDSAKLNWETTDDFQKEGTEFTVRYRQTYPAPYELIAEPNIPGEILFMSDRDGDWELYTVNADGTGLNQITNNEVDDWSGIYSPDGTKIAFDAKHGTAPGDIFVIDADGTNLKNLTSSFSEDAFATWSPDGKQIVFERKINNTYRLHIMNSNGSKIRLLNEVDTGGWSIPAWSPVGSKIAFSGRMDGDTEIYTLDTQDNSMTQITENEGVGDAWPTWSPDGKKIAFLSNSDGNVELFTMNPDGSDREQITENDWNESEPAWSRDGKYIAVTKSGDGVNSLGQSQSEIFLIAADDAETFGPITVGEQANWKPSTSTIATKTSSRKKQIVDSTIARVTPLIVGAEEEKSGDTSFQVAIMDGNNPLQDQYCGGALIKPEWVLTAAHCVTDDNSGFVQASEIKIAVGRQRLSTIGKEDTFDVQAIYPHPSYDRNVNNDIALIHLSKPIPVQMATPMPWLDNSTLPKDGTPILKTGWGSTDVVNKGPYPDDLKSTVVNVIGNHDYDFCGSDTDFVAVSRICSDSPARKGACTGDSGGPNVVEIDGHWFLAGITSYGMTDATNRCAEDVDVMTRVSYYADWITSHVGWQWTWISGIEKNEYEIENLKSDLSYTFQILAENDSTKTPYSDPIIMKIHTPRTTLLDKPSRPLNVEAESKSGEVLISWDYPEKLNGVSFSIQHYEAGELKNTPLNIDSEVTRGNVTRSGESTQEKMIIGGEKAEIVENSHIVALLASGVADATQARFCAGSLIASTWVITAAHCVDGGKSSSNIEISTGIADLSTVKQEDRLQVKNIHIHEGYLASPLTHDLALLELSTSVTSTEANWIPWETNIQLPLDGTEIKTAGWGSTVAGEATKETILRQAQGSVLFNPATNRCGQWSTFDSSQWLCVGGEEKIGSCLGDGGGPVTTGSGLPVLLGVIAWGPEGDCASTRLPNVAARLSTYDDWISQRVGNPWKKAEGITWFTHAIKNLQVGQDYTFFITTNDQIGRRSESVSVNITVKD
jgi:secreted trypsin-like serine protease